jgi:DnaD/phage-associated family protein
MKYTIDVPHFGKFFTVPCGAVENYIKTADGNYIKVLLCLLCSNSNVSDTHQIAEECGVSDSVAEDGILFWKGKGIISAEAVGDSAKPQAVAASVSVNAAGSPKSEPQAKPVCLTDAINPMKNTAAAKSVIRYTHKDIAEKVKKDKDLQILFDEAQRVFGKTINDTETAGLINIYEYYGFDVPSIIMIIEYCKSIGKTRIAYIETVARDWFEQGICEYAEVEAKIIKQTEQDSYFNAAMRAVGLQGKLTPKRQEFFTQWKEWGFDEEMLELAGDSGTDGASKPSVEYVNGILKRWYESGIFTPEDVKRDKAAHVEAKAASNPSYSIEEWKRMASEFDPNTLGFEEDDE